jgi:hypothetical protein
MLSKQYDMLVSCVLFCAAAELLEGEESSLRMNVDEGASQQMA